MVSRGEAGKRRLTSAARFAAALPDRLSCGSPMQSPAATSLRRISRAAVRPAQPRQRHGQSFRTRPRAKVLRGVRSCWPAEPGLSRPLARGRPRPKRGPPPVAEEPGLRVADAARTCTIVDPSRRRRQSPPRAARRPHRNCPRSPPPQPATPERTSGTGATRRPETNQSPRASHSGYCSARMSARQPSQETLFRVLARPAVRAPD